MTFSFGSIYGQPGPSSDYQHRRDEDELVLVGAI